MKSQLGQFNTFNNFLSLCRSSCIFSNCVENSSSRWGKDEAFIYTWKQYNSNTDVSRKMKKKYLKYYIEKGIYKEEKYWYKKYYDKTWTTKKKRS